MEVLEANSASLSNREVLELLRCNSGKKHTNLATILYETTSYLESSPAASYTIPDVAEFLRKVKESNYKLTKMEKIQLVNLKPQNETELHLIIDNIEEKLTEDQRNDLLLVIEQTLSRVPELEECSRKKLKH